MRNFTLIVFLLLPGIASYGVTLEDLEAHPARQAGSWAETQDEPNGIRMGIAPESVIDYLRKDNSYNGYSEVPTSDGIEQKQVTMLKDAVNSLPNEVKGLLDEHVVGIFLVRDLGSTAYTENLNNDDDGLKVQRSFISIDINAVDRPANEWATWRDSSAFAGDSGNKIDLKIATDEENNVTVAITYILLHETGHIVGIANKAHPNWSTGGHPGHFQFSAYSWFYENNRITTVFDKEFPLRKKIKFYRFSASELNSDQIPEIYRQLEKTSFCSLYGSMSMYEDFAECFAQYIHVEMMGRPYVLTIQSEDDSELVIDAPIRSERLRHKKEFIGKLFSNREKQ